MASSDSDSDSTVICDVKLKALIKKRGVVKGKLTLFKKYLSKLASASLTADQLIDLELRTSRVISVFKEFEIIQDKIETISEDLEEHLKERETFENTYFECVALSKGYLAQVSSPGASASPDGNAREVTEPREHESIKYPDIKLPTYNGQITNWIEFRDTFDALVNQTSLKPIQKFKYLKGCLTDSALEVISSLEFAEESHAIAWQLLCERYNSPKTLVYSHLRALFSIDTVPSTATALRSLNDNISKHLRILRSVKVPTNDWDLLIVFLLSSKLDKSLQSKWEEKINSRELPTLQDFKSFLRTQADLREAVSDSQPAGRGLSAREAMVTTVPPSHTNSKAIPTRNTYRKQCPNCKEVHFINQCPNFLALNAATRIRLVKKLGLCLNCLASNHIVPNCRASNCRVCKGKHHTLLHITHAVTGDSNTRHSTFNSSEPKAMASVRVEPPSINLTTNQRQSISCDPGAPPITQIKGVILSTVRVKVFDKDNKPIILRGLLDSGSQSNFLTESACNKLNLPTNQLHLDILGFNQNLTEINESCNLTIHSTDGSFSMKLSCLIVPKICKLHKHAVTSRQLNIPKRFRLADERFYEGGDIDLLIGAEHFYQLLCIGQHSLGINLPLLVRTKLGYVVSGSYSSNMPQQVVCNFIQIAQTQALKTFWNSDNCQSTPAITDREYLQCEKVFNDHSRTPAGNFVVSIPFKESPTCLGQSRLVAYKRFKTLESKFSRNPELKKNYVNFMRDFENAGHMVQTKVTEHCNFLPHHAVLTPHKVTTPLRVVMDCSFQTNNGKSLNSIQYTGTMNQDDLVNILLRFRKNKYVISADIERMYRMIYINPNQRHLQCIFWRENETEPLRVYTLSTLSFGLRSAPHIATRCLEQLAQECQQQHPEAAAAIRDSFYMDDLLYAGDDELQVQETAVCVQRILRGANFHLRKWKSNSVNVLKAVSNTEYTHKTPAPTSLAHDTHKVLGLAWCSSSDNLMYQLKIEPVSGSLTKRKVLSLASAIFDPLGLINPTLVIAKLIIKRLWDSKFQWDQSLPIIIINEWQTFYHNLFTLNSLRIPRHALISEYVTLEMHGFSDSSLTAFGCAIYLRTINMHGHIVTRLLCSKSRVARKETIPKLELRAMVLLAQLYEKVNKALKCNFTTVYLWCDSNVALSWAKSQKINNLDCFVKNRVTVIQRLTDTKDWHWISSNDNPADLLTRGMQADKLVDCALWWEGPSWLGKHSDAWPSNCTDLTQFSDVELTEINCNITTNMRTNLFIDHLFNRWSNVNNLINCVAFIYRFANNCLRRNEKRNGPLSAKELETALNKLIEISQVEMFPSEYNLLKNKKPLLKSSNLLPLNPFMENNLIRVGGRLGLSAYDHNKKHPIILPHKHVLTKLILSELHVRLLHVGPQLLLSSARERFWPINGKTLANKIVEKCVTCFRAKPRSQTPIMGNLPPTRVTPAPPFLFTMLDYGGPYTARDRRGRGYKTYKCYIAIFTCMTTKAVHIELISGLQTAAFISAFRRFTARRGTPKELLTDNATTFHGASNELAELYDFLNEHSNDLISTCAKERIQWKFLPPYAPHMGGLHESAIRRCKFHLKRVLGQALLTYEEFYSILVQVEGILNSKPLCPIPNSNTDEITCLTPAHFLICRTPNYTPDYDYKDIPTNQLTHYQQLQQLQQDFWSSWSRDYIGLLQERIRWRSSKGPALRTGTVVLVREERLPPCLWRLGRIISCCPGRDGVTRVAEMQTARGIIKRSFNNICPLPIDAIDV